MESKNKYAYSFDGETYINELFDSAEDAINDATKEILCFCKEVPKGEVVIIGKVVNAFIPRIYGNDIIYNLQGYAYNDSDRAEEYLEDVTDKELQELETDLNKVLAKWIKKYNYHPNWFEVTEEKKYKYINGKFTEITGEE